MTKKSESDWNGLYSTPEYHDAVVRQLLLWHNGRPTHHTLSKECCPDFSCCFPELYESDAKQREEMLEAARRKTIEVRKEAKEKRA